LIDADQLEAQDDEQFLVYEEMVEDGEDMDEFPPDDDPEASVMAAAEAAHQADIQEQQLERAAKRRRNFFICDECGQLFNDEYVYNEHLDGHQDRREMKQFFPCPECPKTYTKKALLKQHRAQVHTGQRQFRCSICNDAYTTSKPSAITSCHNVLLKVNKIFLINNEHRSGLPSMRQPNQGPEARAQRI